MCVDSVVAWLMAQDSATRWHSSPPGLLDLVGRKEDATVAQGPEAMPRAPRPAGPGWVRLARPREAASKAR